MKLIYFQSNVISTFCYSDLVFFQKRSKASLLLSIENSWNSLIKTPMISTQCKCNFKEIYNNEKSRKNAIQFPTVHFHLTESCLEQLYRIVQISSRYRRLALFIYQFFFYFNQCSKKTTNKKCPVSGWNVFATSGIGRPNQKGNFRFRPRRARGNAWWMVVGYRVTTTHTHSYGCWCSRWVWMQEKHTHWQIISGFPRWWCWCADDEHTANECLTMTLDKGCWNQCEREREKQEQGWESKRMLILLCAHFGDNFGFVLVAVEAITDHVVMEPDFELIWHNTRIKKSNWHSFILADQLEQSKTKRTKIKPEQAIV